jgi:hypothetical protein
VHVEPLGGGKRVSEALSLLESRSLLMLVVVDKNVDPCSFTLAGNTFATGLNGIAIA